MNSAILPTSRADEPNWNSRNQLLNQRARQGNPDLAFIGDSITAGWETEGKSVWQEFFGQRRTINLGIDGDRTEHVIWRLTHGNLVNIQPQAAILLIGTNNTGHLMQNPQEVAAGVRRILEILSETLPPTLIILLGLFPRGRTENHEMRLNNMAINTLIRDFGDEQQIHFHDFSEIFLESNGTIPEGLMPDELHLSEAGYRRWAQALEPILVKFGL